MVIVAGEDKATNRRRLAVEEQQSIGAMSANQAGLERRIAHIRGGNQRAGIVPRSCSCVLRSIDWIDAQHVPLPSLLAVKAFGFFPIAKDEIGIGRLAEGHP